MREISAMSSLLFEHLLAALLDNAETCHALVACGVNIDRLKAGLSIYIEETTPCIPPDTERDIQPTLSFSTCFFKELYIKFKAWVHLK